MKPFDMQTGMNDIENRAPIMEGPIERLLKRNKEVAEKKKEEVSNIDEINRFIEHFNSKQREIESDFSASETMDCGDLPEHFDSINTKIQSLLKFYSNSTFFLRIYDKKVCQKSLHTLQDKFQELEGRMLPRKKFGFKSRKNKIEKVASKPGDDWVDTAAKCESLCLQEVMCGFRDRDGEDLELGEKVVEKQDVLLSGMRNCTIRLLGTPSTLHVANLESCHVICGPVATSVFIEHVKQSTFQLACQQLRIHDTCDTDFHVHVTSKAIIEDSKDIRFGVYTLNYENIDNHYEISGLNRSINNWDSVDDFNWLVADKPSPNWSKLHQNNSQVS